MVQARPIDIEHDQFLVLGDNSPISSDSRFWNDTEPWVQQHMFDPTDDPDPQTGRRLPSARTHVVPRGLMVGRAFFIYFPAPYPATASGRAIIPNFGQMQFIH